MAKEETIAVRYVSGALPDVDTLVDFKKAGKLHDDTYPTIGDELEKWDTFLSRALLFP